MPDSAVLTFTDPDDYAAAIRATRAEMTVTGRGQFAAKITRIDLHRLWMQRFSDNLPRVGHSAAVMGRAIISFRTHPGPSLLWGGAEMGPTNITRHSEGQSFVSAFIWVRLLGRHVAADGGYGFGRDGDCWMRPAATARCAHRHTPTLRDDKAPAPARGGQLAEDAPEIIANPEAARGLEQALIQAMMDCPRGSGGTRGQVSAAAPRDRPAPVSQGRRSKPRSHSVFGGTLRGRGSVGPYAPRLLPGVFGHEPDAISVASADAFGSPSAASGRSGSGERDRDRDELWLLGIRALFCGLSVVVRGVALGIAAAATRRSPTAKKCRFSVATSGICIARD